MTATSLDLSQIKTDALSSAATFRTLIGLGSSDAVTFAGLTLSEGLTARSIVASDGVTFRLGYAYTINFNTSTPYYNLHRELGARYHKNLKFGWTSGIHATQGGMGLGFVHTDTATASLTLADGVSFGALQVSSLLSHETLNVYNTYTSDTSFENLQLQWNTNEARIGTSVGSAGGTQRVVVFGSWDSANAWNPALTITPQGVPTFSMGTVTSSQPFTITQTWNNGATTFTGALLNITDTASASASLLMDLQVGGSSKFKIRKDGYIFGASASFSVASFYQVNGNQNRTVMHQSLGFITGAIHGGYKWTGGNSVASSFDLVLERDAPDTMAQRRGTNAQTFRLYNTYTSSTSYERGFMRWNSNVLEIGTEAGSSGGSNRSLKFYSNGNGYEFNGEANGGLSIGAPTSYRSYHIGGGTKLGSYSSSIGWGSTTSTSFSTAIGAFSTSQYIGRVSFSAGQGPVQTHRALPGIQVLTAKTTDDTQTPMSLVNTGLSTHVACDLKSNRGLTIKGIVTAQQNDNSQTSGWDIFAVFQNDGGTLTLVGSTINSINNNSNAWSISIAANDTNDRWELLLTGETGKTIHWVANLLVAEVAF